MNCPACGYMMSPFDANCPRCQGKGIAPVQSLPGSPGTVNPAVPVTPGPTGPLRPCPYCSEPIQVSAKKCRYCNEWLEKAQGRAGTLYSGSADARATAKGLKKFETDKQIYTSAMFILSMLVVGFILWVEANWGEQARNYATIGVLVLVAIVGWLTSRWYHRE